MALEGPQLAYSNPQARVDEQVAADAFRRALELARKVEDLLEQARSMSASASASASASVGDASAAPRAHATRMACAMAASLVDELEAIVRPSRHSAAS